LIAVQKSEERRRKGWKTIIIKTFQNKTRQRKRRNSQRKARRIQTTRGKTKKRQGTIARVPPSNSQRMGAANQSNLIISG